MGVKTQIKNYEDIPFKSPWKDISSVNRWGIVVSSGLMAVTLIVSWIIFATVCRTNINELLTVINSEGFLFTFSYLQLIIVIILLAVLFFSLLTIPFIFLKKNNLVSLLLASLSILLAIILICGWIIFAVYANKGFQVAISSNGASSIFFFIFPWVFTIIFLNGILVFSVRLVYTVLSSGKKLKFKEEILFEPELEQPENTLVEPEVANSFPSITNDIVVEPLSSQNINLIMQKRSIHKKSDDEADFSELEYNRLKNSPLGTSPATMPLAEVLIDESKSKVSQPFKPSLSETLEFQVPIPKHTPNAEPPELSNQPTINDVNNNEENLIKPTSGFVKNNYSSQPSINDLAKTELKIPPYAKVIDVVTLHPVVHAEVSQPLKPSMPEVPAEIVVKPIVPLKVWTQEQIDKTWEKGLFPQIKKYDYESETYRLDYAGALIFKHSFVANPNIDIDNNPRSYAWTIVYQRPLSHGGTADFNNLWPLNCMNALTKGEDYPHWKTTITFNGKENYMKVKKWKGKRRLPKK